tara:strand:+ start:1040 stop:1948 length:909 start_codon:yes stop_codon:yes gene_type:complete
LKNKILIVGGTGFMGQNLLKRCIKDNLNITVLSSSRKKIRKKSYKQIFCDISKRKELIKKLKNKNFDYVVNLAGYVDHSKKGKTLKTHYNGCKNLVDYFKNQKLKKFIQVGSSVEYGKIKAPQIESKKTKVSSLKSHYGIAKLKSTKYLLELNKKKSFPCTILRFFLVYGPGQSENRLIPFVIKSCLRKKTFYSSSGNQVRDFLYIDDAVESMMKCLKNKKSNGQIINICSSSPVKIKLVINKIWKIIKKGEPLFGKIRLRPDEPKKLYSNYFKAKKILKWKPKIDLNQGIKKTIKYYEQRI